MYASVNVHSRWITCRQLLRAVQLLCIKGRRVWSRPRMTTKGGWAGWNDATVENSTAAEMSSAPMNSLLDTKTNHRQSKQSKRLIKSRRIKRIVVRQPVHRIWLSILPRTRLQSYSAIGRMNLTNRSSRVVVRGRAWFTFYRATASPVKDPIWMKRLSKHTHSTHFDYISIKHTALRINTFSNLYIKFLLQL